MSSPGPRRWPISCCTCRSAGDVGGIAILLFLLLEFRNQRRYAQVLFMALFAIGMVGVALASDKAALFLAGWRRGAAYAAFFLALTTLRDAAETSPLVRRCGQHLVAQPPGRRYAALTAGGHVFGITLSYGAIELLAAMVMRANTLESAGGSADIQGIRTRRMLLAIYRGFCVMNCWSPINIMTAVVSTAVPAAPMRLLLPIAFVVSVGMTALGWIEDRLSGARLQTRGGLASGDQRILDDPLAHRRVDPAGHGAGRRHGNAVRHFTGHRRDIGRAADRVGVAGRAIVALRRIRASACLPSLLRRRAQRFLLRVPTLRSEATVLGGSGFMGVAIGSVLPAIGLTPLLAALPPVTIPLLIPLLLIATGQLGLNPGRRGCAGWRGDPGSRGIRRGAGRARVCLHAGLGARRQHDADVEFGDHHRPLGRRLAVDGDHALECLVHLVRVAAGVGGDRAGVPGVALMGFAAR